MSLNQAFPNQSKNAELQRDILDLFNRLIKRKAAQNRAQLFARILSDVSNDIDDEHEIDENVRIALEKKFNKIPANTLDASQLLTDGPFKGMSLLWVTCYIGASRYTFFDEDGVLSEGYSYLLSQLLDKSMSNTVRYTTEFKFNNRTISAFWLVIYAHLKTLSKNGMWIFDEIVDSMSDADLRQQNFNVLSHKDDRVALSPLAMLIEADVAVARSNFPNRDFVHTLLNKVRPKHNPGFFDFNAPVLDMKALGMTTLCFAAKGDADLIKSSDISYKSPFIAILQTADPATLNFKAKIRKGPDQGKTPLWYAAFMLAENDEECITHILDNVSFAQLDLNDQPENPDDKHAAISALWFVAHHYARHHVSSHIETLFAKCQDLSKFDFNSTPKNVKDLHAGKSVLWNLGEAAFNGKSRPFIRALKIGKTTNLNYGARAVNGPNYDKSVLGFALALAMTGNFKALDLILENIKTYELSADAIQGYELEMLCELAKRNCLYPLEVLLPFIKMEPAFLNRETTSRPGINVLYLLVELAWFGYPHFLKNALKGINIDALTPGKKVKNEENQRILKELNNIVNNVSCYGAKQDRPIMQRFLESGYEELAEQLESKLKLTSTAQADIMDYNEIAGPITTLIIKFNLLAVKTEEKPQHRKTLRSKMKF